MGQLDVMNGWVVVFTEFYKDEPTVTAVAGSMEALEQIIENVTGEKPDAIMEYYWITQTPLGRKYKRATGEVVTATAIPVLMGGRRC